MVDLADLLVEDPGRDEAAEHADAAGPRACGVPQLRFWVGCRRDDHLGDHGGVVPGLHPLRQDGFEGLPSPLVDRQWVLTPHHARVEAGARVEGLDEQNPDTVLANLVVHGLGVALDRVLGRDIAGHEGLGRESADRRHVDDASAPLRAHVGQDGLGHADEAEDVDVEDDPVLGDGALLAGTG